jgi:hypothetical protein
MQELSEQFQIDDKEKIKKMTMIFLKRFNYATIPDTPIKTAPIGEDKGPKTVESLEIDLAYEKERSLQLAQDNEKLTKQLEDTLKSSVPNLEAIKQDIAEKEKAKYEKEKKHLIKDLHSRINKVHHIP